MKKFLKEQKGFAASDALIAILIITLFSGLIATISYNIYLSNRSIKRMSKATNYIVDVFEYIDKANYNEVTEENLINYFNSKYYYEEDGTVKIDTEVKALEEDETIENIDTPFKAEINIVKYKDIEGTLDTEELDLVQEITMSVTYKLGNKEQKIEMKTNKIKKNDESLLLNETTNLEETSLETDNE